MIDDVQDQEQQIYFMGDNIAPGLKNCYKVKVDVFLT